MPSRVATRPKDPDPEPLEVRPPPEVDPESQIRAETWYATSVLRLRMQEEGIVRTAHDDELHGQCQRLERAGYAREVGKGAWSLTPEGRHTLDWAGAPKPSFLTERQWAAELSRAIATHHRVNVHVMLRTTKDVQALRARARLCFALFARGWPVERVARHFGLDESSVVKSLGRWRRERDRLKVEGYSR